MSHIYYFIDPQRNVWLLSRVCLRQSFALVAQVAEQWRDLSSLQSPSDPPASASQSVGITGMGHHTQPKSHPFWQNDAKYI